MSSTSSHELNFQEMDAALASIDIPPCPATVTAVMAEAQKDAPDVNVLTRIVSGDVGMSAFALKLANSALFRRGGVTDNVSQAIARLGTRNLLCIVVAVALRNSMADALPADFLDRFWKHSNGTALAGGMVARKLRGIPADLAYTFGLFHDAAIPVMMRRFADYASALEEASAGEKTLPEIEDARYHCTHAIVGAMLARNWGLPKGLADAIRYHHSAAIYAEDSDLLSAESRGLIAVNHVGTYLMVKLSGETDHDVEALFPLAVAYLGLDEDELHDLSEDLAEALNG
jgi:HD-like signal output (HDOD) protein